MSFHVFANSTTADASDVNDTFYYIAQGSRQPFTQTAAGSLTAVDATYDIGASATTWNNVYANNLYISDSVATSDKSLWVLLADVTLSATASSINITGLNGDDEEVYKIVTFIKSGGNNAPFLLQLNGTTSSYGYQRILAESTTVSATRSTGERGFYLGACNTNSSCFSETLLYAKTGNERLAVTRSLIGGTNTIIDHILAVTSIFDNTSKTVTSIKLEANVGGAPINDFLTGTVIKLWGRQ